MSGLEADFLGSKPRPCRQVETKKVYRRNEMFELTIELLSPRDFLPAVETDYLLPDD